MKQYRKKPVTIEAVQFDGLNLTEIKDFVGDDCEVEIYDNWVTPPVARIVIHTLEGDMEVSKKDYVIKGVKGEFYPCKPDIFEQTYESEEPDKSLEEASKDAVCMAFGGDPAYYGNKAEFSVNECMRLFIAGAEWQASQMPMPEDTVLFNKGVAEGRRLEREDMMKDAVEGEVHPDDCEIWVNLIEYGYKFNDGDKVKVIVLKEEEE